MNMWIKTIFLVFLFQNLVFSQSLKKITKLDNKLNEISGLEVLNDSCLLAINDGGNQPFVYVLNLFGEIINEVKVLDAKNVDWEDLTIDEQGNIYIADIGNNLNQRKNLCIYKVKSDSILFKKEVSCEVINFQYEDQTSFPPLEDLFNFDSEALAYHNNELYIFTKCRTKPFSGVTNVYKLPCSVGNKLAKKYTSIQLKHRKMKFDSVTAADFSEGKCYILTYTGLEIFSLSSDKFTKIERISFPKLTQKESVCVFKNHIYLADEKVKSVFDAKLYKVKLR